MRPHDFSLQRTGTLRCPFTESTFAYLKPTDDQMETMGEARTLVAEFAEKIHDLVPEGPDKTFILRSIRTVGMWINVAITRHSDGAPREEQF